MVDRLSPIDRNLKPPQPVRQNSRTAIRRRRLRVVMVDRLSPIDRNLKPPQTVGQNSRTAIRRPRLRVVMVDRLSPIDRNLKPPQPVRQNSRTAIRRRRLRVVMVDRLSPIDRNLKPPRPVRQNSRTAIRRRRLRVVMVDRLSPIDRNLKPPQPVGQNSRTAIRRRRLRVGRSHWGQWLYTVRRRRLRVVMVDRLSPIDRNLKPPRPVRQNSRTAIRRRRLRVGRSHWGQWLYTVRRRRLRVVMVDRLSPIDRNLKPPQTVRQNSRTAIRRRRLRVGRSHWGQWLYTVRRRRLCVGTYFPSETLEQSLLRSKSKELVAPVI
jgi:hypothetical protein